MPGPYPAARWIPVILLGSLAACTGTIIGGDDPGGSTSGGAGAGEDDGDGDDGGALADDPDAPVLLMSTPLRGTIAESSNVLVSGRVTATTSAIASVEVNHQDVLVASDGSFETSISLPQGITLVETTVSDVEGRRRRDVRAVLAGTMTEPATPVSNGVTAHLGPRTISGFVGMLADVGNGLNLTAMAQALNPIAGVGSGCNGAQVYVDSVYRSSVAVGAVPISGGIDTGVQVRDLVAHGHVTFRLLCVGGSAGWTISATSFGVRGTVQPSVSGGVVHIGLASVLTGFGGFGLSIGGVPGFVTDLIAGPTRDKLAQILRDKIVDIVPPLAGDFLGDFLSDSWNVHLLGRTVTFAVTPSSMSWSNVGGSIGLRASSWLDVATDAPYLSDPQPSPSSSTMVSADLRAAVADDLVNQLMTSLWASGAFEATTSPEIGDAITGLGLDVPITTVRVSMLLPPVADFDTTTGAAHLSIGDLVVEPLDAAGAPISTITISAEIDLAALTSSSGHLQIATLPPRVVIEALDHDGNVADIIDSDMADDIAQAAVEQVAAAADDLMVSLPIPGLPGATFTQPGMGAIAGYLVVGGTISFLAVIDSPSTVPPSI